jgi:three-Cys-motif partner protein
MPFIDPSPEYWREYSNLQRVKHDLIRAYFNGWFPKLGFWAGRILYVDTHAGRGSHVGGQLGSPLVVLDALQSHAARDKILTKSEIVFFFIERVPEYAQELQGELARYSELPSRVECNVVSGDCFEFLSSVIKSLRGPGGQSAPAFFFIDPYGFKVPGENAIKLMEKHHKLFYHKHL